MTIIKGRGGKIGGGAVSAEVLATTEFINGYWHLDKADGKQMRDKTARELRKDGWEVETKTYTIGYFLEGKRRRRET